MILRSRAFSLLGTAKNVKCLAPLRPVRASRVETRPRIKTRWRGDWNAGRIDSKECSKKTFRKPLHGSRVEGKSGRKAPKHRLEWPFNAIGSFRRFVRRDVRSRIGCCRKATSRRNKSTGRSSVGPPHVSGMRPFRQITTARYTITVVTAGNCPPALMAADLDARGTIKRP